MPSRARAATSRCTSSSRSGTRAAPATGARASCGSHIRSSSSSSSRRSRSPAGASSSTRPEAVAYFRGEGAPLPSVVQLDPVTRGHALYSLHDPVHGLKAGAHHAGARIGPDDEGGPDPALVERAAEWVARTYPDADPEPIAAETCMYTTTP